MYQILGVSRSLTLFGFLCGVIFVVLLVLAPPEHASLLAWWSLAVKSVSVAGLLVWLIGATPLFPLLCKLPYLRRWFPPIEGEWAAALESNWPAIDTRSQPAQSEVLLAPVHASVTIIARLFFIRMNLAAADRYSTSKTIFVHAERDPHDGSISLHYVYRNTTLDPRPTDSAFHLGAGCLTIEGKDDDIWFEGVYWTNRNWRRGLNTAGKITLRRAAG
ncbi:Cap15 family cyclic dinucleotide receptor domain-containing protein [Roseixanthobacter liquoris]|uniref:Cap15 family cyclic dinucleotide receptor domain-containing protein n=1 Tax=Roseixanthobacter liquoris TaxID=3119921 RepID=UPI003726258D